MNVLGFVGRALHRLSYTRWMPEAHAGRLFDHVHLRVSDLETSRRFYAAALAALGHELGGGESYFTFDELWVTSDGEPTRGIHLAFQALDRETVDRFFDAAMGAGGRNNGRPGERDYHPGYYACYVLDPDGNNIEAVHHGPAERSAPSVVFRWVEPGALDRGPEPCP